MAWGFQGNIPKWSIPLFLSLLQSISAKETRSYLSRYHLSSAAVNMSPNTCCISREGSLVGPSPRVQASGRPQQG